jgi:hypothetical protein
MLDAMRIQEPPLSGTIEPLKGVALVQQRNAAPLAVRRIPPFAAPEASRRRGS